MKTKIKIANKIELPLDAVTQTFAEIGRKGAGKTYLASMIAEQMLDVQAQVIVIDPIGNWWGLRVDKNGKSKGKDIFIIGGSHGDVSLSSDAGKEIAKFLVETNISVVLDISEFRKNERKKFVTDFAEEFFHLKKSKPSPVHIFLEESQKFCPQQVQKDEARMLGAWEDIVRLGRNYGIGCSLISQRPQSINKEVLSQVECLFVLQVTGLHERKALEGWVQEAGADRKLVGHLPSLARGEGFVWSPSWLKVFEKVKFSTKTTFDTSATPELGKATRTAKISKMNIDKLRKQMDTVIGEAKQEFNDLKDCKKEINRLNAELKKTKNTLPVDEKQIQHIQEDAEKLLGREHAKTIKTNEIHYVETLNERERNFRKIVSDNKTIVQKLTEKINAIAKLAGADMRIPNIVLEIPKLEKYKSPTPTKQEPKTIQRYIQPAQTPQLPESTPEYSDDSNGEEDSKPVNIGATRMLQQLANHNPRPLTKYQIATLAKLSFKSGTFGQYLGQLRRRNWITQSGNKYSITEGGLEQIEHIQNLPTDSQEAVQYWGSKFNAGASRMLTVIAQVHPNSVTKEEIAEQTGMTGTSGTFGQYIGQIKRNELITIEGKEITATPLLFLEDE